MTMPVSSATCLFVAFFVLVLPCPVHGGDDILINDFEAADYGDWKVEGKAFGKAPAKGTLSGQMPVTGFEGKGLVNTFLGGDGPKGKLTSPPFTIERDYITFLIGGGGHGLAQDILKCDPACLETDRVNIGDIVADNGHRIAKGIQAANA